MADRLPNMDDNIADDGYDNDIYRRHYKTVKNSGLPCSGICFSVSVFTVLYEGHIYNKAFKPIKNAVIQAALEISVEEKAAENIFENNSEANKKISVHNAAIHQREDKQLDVHLELNGKFSAGTSYFIEPELYPEDIFDDWNSEM